jgi:hypothetical protein
LLCQVVLTLISIFLIICIPNSILGTTTQDIPENSPLVINKPQLKNSTTTPIPTTNTLANKTNPVSLIGQVNITSLIGGNLTLQPTFVPERHPDPEAFEIAKREANLRANRTYENETATNLLASSINPSGSNRIQISGFEGMNFFDGGSYVPSDAQIAAGPNSIIEMINAAVKIWIRSGCCFAGASIPISANEFFNVSANDKLSDPRILFDAISGRYFATIADFTTSSTLIAVSQTFDPMGVWKVYTFVFSNCPDQPAIGISDDKFIVAANVYQLRCDGGFAGSQYVIINKNDMLRGVTFPNADYSAPDLSRSFLYPIQSLSSSPTLFMITTQWGLEDALVLYSFNGPVISGTRTEVDTTSIPIRRTFISPDAVQPASTFRIDTVDARVISAVWKNGVLWFGLNTGHCEGLIVQGECIGTLRTGFRLMEVDTTSTTVKQDFDVWSTSRDLFGFPALTLDAYNNLGVIFGYSSPTSFPGLLFSGQTADAESNSLNIVPKILQFGRAADQSHRYGDYFGAAVDPSDPTTLWFAGQYMTNTLDFTIPVYSTFISRVQMPPPTVAPGITIQGPSNVVLDGVGNPHLVRAGTITLNYQVGTTGLQDPLQITWSSDGRISNRGGEATSITFTYPSLNPGHSVSKYVAVHVTDALGQTLETRKSVLLYARPCEFPLPYWNSETQICQRFPP